MNTELVTVIISALAILVSIYSARVSASKTSVEGLSALVDRLEKRLEEEVRRGNDLERKVFFYEKYIEKLIRQLIDNNIKPVDAPKTGDD